MIIIIIIIMIFSICIDYRSAASIGIPIVLVYLKRTLELLISTFNLKYNKVCKFMVYSWYNLMTFYNNVPHIYTSNDHKYLTNK